MLCEATVSFASSWSLGSVCENEHRTNFEDGELMVARLHTHRTPTHPHTHTSFFLRPNLPMSVVFMMHHEKLQIAVGNQTSNRKFGFAAAATGAQGRRK